MNTHGSRILCEQEMAVYIDCYDYRSVITSHISQSLLTRQSLCCNGCGSQSASSQSAVYMR